MFGLNPLLIELNGFNSPIPALGFIEVTETLIETDGLIGATKGGKFHILFAWFKTHANAILH